MTQINFIDKEHEIILLDWLYPYFDHDWIDIGKVYPLLESKEIIKELNKIMVGVDVDPKDINDQIFEFKYLANKYLKDEESKILIPKIKNIEWTLIIPLKLALIFDIWSWFADKLYQPQIVKNTSKKFYDKYTDKAFEIADIYTMIFCKWYNQEHYYLDKWLYWEAKEMFWKLNDLNIREQQKEQELLEKFCLFLEELDSIKGSEEKNLLGIKVSKQSFKKTIEKWKGAVSPYNIALFLKLFTDTKTVLYLVKTEINNTKLLPYEVFICWEKSLCNDLIMKWKEWIIVSPFREFNTPINKRLEEWNKLNIALANDSNTNNINNEIMDKCIKDIEKCARIGANRLEIKFNNHIPTEMTHYLSVWKSADNIWDIKDYILNEWWLPSHFWTTILWWSKVAFEWRKKYSYKTNWKIP